ncbi:MAG: Asp-tRNA(Asn)/Glu-tRNA(Gln) amidotransferase subunit GatC [Candidatus Poribacteria bacterium]|nr:Asp-tRNA(Asn)/Glu-tRNA(Gln) amidotransferase subunit GatC [Candidatus Poribacteria bacterium]
MPTITTEGVRHVANLARLEFNDEETAHFTEQLTRILDYIGKLNELDTEDVPPTSHIHPHQVVIMGGSQTEAAHVAKPDVVKPSYPREQVLANAPEPEAGYFGVPRVVDRSH